MKRNIGMLLLRMLIGWHFLYEGIYKLIQPGGWSSLGYLKTSQWLFSSTFHFVADTPQLLKLVDLLNVWCLDAEAVTAYMENLEQPWIAFKTLAAGAIHPREAFPYAFKSGADFICVGMYDFQLVDNVNLINEVLAQKIERSRPWCA